MSRGIRAASPSSILIDFRWNGRRCREKLKLPPTAANLKHVRRMKAAIQHEIATNTFDYDRHFPGRSPATENRSAQTIRAFVWTYVESLRSQVEPETLDDYFEYGEILGQAFNGPPGELTRKIIRDWVASKDLSLKRLNNLLTPLRGAYRQAVDDGVFTSNPLDGFKVRRVGPLKASRIDPFTREEIKVLGETEHGAIWTFWAWTGLRTGELIALKRTDIDDRGIHVRRALRDGRLKGPKTKSGVRIVRLLEPAQRAVDTLLRDDSVYLMINPADHEPFTSDKSIRLLFAKACREAGVRYRYPYQLRHTYASLALSAGENVHWVARQMGHANALMVLKVYGQWMPDVDPNAGGKMQELT